MNRGYKYENLTDKYYGIMHVLEQVATERKGRYWLCECTICGYRRLISTTGLNTGKFEKCNCKRFKDNTYQECDTYFKIYFPNSEKYFICDKDDFYKYCISRKWCLDGRGYVCSRSKEEIIRFHRIVMNVFDKELEVDHINGNPLDNRKNNLRICKHFENSKNLALKSNNTSGTPGVCYFKRTNEWTAEIKVNYQKIHLGYFKTKDEAVQARKIAEKKYFGEYSTDLSRGSYIPKTLEEILSESKN